MHFIFIISFSFCFLLCTTPNKVIVRFWNSLLFLWSPPLHRDDPLIILIQTNYTACVYFVSLKIVPNYVYVRDTTVLICNHIRFNSYQAW